MICDWGATVFQVMFVARVDYVKDFSKGFSKEGKGFLRFVGRTCRYEEDLDS